jgi:hypothetical protein
MYFEGRPGMMRALPPQGEDLSPIDISIDKGERQ